MKLPKFLQLKADLKTSQPVKDDKVLTSIQQKNVYRYKSDIKRWRDSLSMAEDIMYHDRNPLLSIYKEVELDSNISALVELKKDRISQYKFHLIDENGDEDIKSTIFNSKWFFDLLDTYIDSMMYGFSLIQINSVKDFKLDLELIPMEYILIDFKKYRKTLYDKTGKPYNVPEMEDWLIEIDFKNLGLYNKLAPLSIWKKSAMQNWASFQEIYGHPIRIGKTNSYKPEDRARFERFLKDMGSNSYAIFDENMNIEFVETSNTDAYNLYNEMIKMVDSEISKLIIGGSMVNSDGSSLSQSQVHDKQADIKTFSDLNNIQFWVNDYLIPKLNLHGFDITSRFEFIIKENMISDWTIDKDIIDRFEVDAQWVADKYGIPVIKQKTNFTSTPLI